MAAARDGIDALLRDRGLRRTDPALTAESLLQGAVASAALEGSTSTAEDVRSGRADETAASAVRVSAQLLSLVPVLPRAPLQALARLHVLASPPAGAAQTRGRPRDPAAARRLTSLARRLTTPSTAPALVVAALVHAELATVAPFGSADGLVARAAERLVLVVRGVDPTSLTVPEAGHLGLRRAYASNLRGYATGTPAGVQAWLLYAAEAYTAGAQASPLATRS
jgi:Fic family protein